MAEISDELDDLAGDTIGAAIEVHRKLGPGFREKTYANALAIECDIRGISFEREHGYSIVFKDREVGRGNIDFLVDDRLVVELKTVEQLVDKHTAQDIAYLRATGNQLGLLLNFSHSTLKDGIERVVYTKT